MRLPVRSRMGPLIGRVSISNVEGVVGALGPGLRRDDGGGAVGSQ